MLPGNRRRFTASHRRLLPVKADKARRREPPWSVLDNRLGLDLDQEALVNQL